MKEILPCCAFAVSIRAVLEARAWMRRNGPHRLLRLQICKGANGGARGYNVKYISMDEKSLRASLLGLPVVEVVYLAETGSTNDVAQSLLGAGAPDGTLVFADAQTQGRGRLNRRWLTEPGASLAFSLALRPNRAEQDKLALFAPLAGLAVCLALVEDYGLPAEVKWPNDVLLKRRKVCGVLVEATWQGERLEGVVVGIGVNVAPPSVPADGEALFPATCVQAALGRPVEREELLIAILTKFFLLRPTMGSLSFLQTWEERLAFRGEVVQVDLPGKAEQVRGRVVGIDGRGNLRLAAPAGEEIHIAAGDLRLRPQENR